MLDILHGLCESNNLVVHQFDNGLEAVNSKIAVPCENNDKQEYYLLLECGLVDDGFIEKLLNEHIENFMDNLEELDITDESFIKNCTLILCCEAGNISERALLNFEENPYFFKKNIITYFDNELISLKEKLMDQFNNENLNKLLVGEGGGLFESFKTLSLEKGNYYPLLIRVITKLPFVHYLPQKNQLENLDVFVRNELSTSDLKLLDFICDSDEKLSDKLIDTKISAVWGEL